MKEKIMSKMMLALATISLIAGVSAKAAENKKEAKQATLEQSVTKVREECKSDVSKLCKSVPEGEGRVMSCLWTKRGDVSDSCKKSISEADAAASRALDKADVQFRKSCGADVQKFCSEVPSGKGRLLDCLGENQNGLSNSCRSFQTKLQDKIEQVESAASG
jgi:hypothetical protein